VVCPYAVLCCVFVFRASILLLFSLCFLVRGVSVPCFCCGPLSIDVACCVSFLYVCVAAVCFVVFGGCVNCHTGEESGKPCVVIRLELKCSECLH